MPMMHPPIVLVEIMNPGEGLGPPFALKNSTNIRHVPLLMLFTKMAVEIIFAAALHWAILFRTGKLTGLLCNVTTGI